MAAPKITVPITITDANKGITFKIGIPQLDAAIATGAYEDIHAVLTALASAMTIACGSTITVTISNSGSVAGKVVISKATGTLQLLWNTGTTYSGSSCIGGLLGYNVTADDTGSLSYTSDYQHQYGWYSPRSPSTDSEKIQEFIGSELVTTMDSSNANVLDVGFRTIRHVEFYGIPAAQTLTQYATSTNVNRDFEHVWEVLVGGAIGIYYPDMDVTGTHDHFWLREPRNMSAIARIKKLQFFTIPLDLVIKS